MKKPGFLIGMASILLAGVVYYALTQQKEIDFSTQVKPILNQHCISCHGGVKKNGDLACCLKKKPLLLQSLAIPPSYQEMPMAVSLSPA